MTKYINDDGNFIIWYYAVGGKFVISVRLVYRAAVFGVDACQPVKYDTSLTEKSMFTQKPGICL